MILSLALDVVQVTWVDVESDAKWKSVKKFLKERPPVCHTVGFVVEDGPEFLKLAATINPEKDDCSDTVLIPKGMILDRTIIMKG